jgi:hypothetical protein
MAIDSHTPGQDDIQMRLKAAQQEYQRLREENERLRALLGIDPSLPNKPVSQAISLTKLSSIATNEVYTPEKKIALFRNLFHGREDVFAMRWEGMGGKSTDEVIRNHLTGKQTIGIYPLLPDETCWLLAVDFDKKSWMADVAAFVAICRRFHVPGVVERSRSGNGAHVWIFFDRPVSAVAPHLPQIQTRWQRPREGRHSRKESIHLSTAPRSCLHPVLLARGLLVVLNNLAFSPGRNQPHRMNASRIRSLLWISKVRYFLWSRILS